MREPGCQKLLRQPLFRHPPHVPKPSHLSSCNVGLDGLDVESGGEGRSLDVVVACVPEAQSAHGPHTAMVECAEHPAVSSSR